MRLIGGAAAIYAIGALTPIPNALIIPLESVYPRVAPKPGETPTGIIVLGGAIDTLTGRGRNEITLSEAGERMTEAVALVRRYPGAQLVFSGGDGALVYASMPEARAARRFFAEMGLNVDRIRFEDRSRNTYENAIFTRDMLKPAPGQRWLLVTSAFHMPRAVRCFHAAGFDVTPWPVDYRTRGAQDLLRVPPRASEGWRRIDLTVKEWVGLIAYRLSGRC
jgi:uncharacterized SAM-binding protein YcdF (DUF218 family)